jgi:CelD/BcsL family acetyltransferase involved in cellulose biosynthesis
LTYEVSEISERDQFQALESDWDALLGEASCDLPFLTHDWFRLWWEHFGKHRRVAILVARKAGKLVFAMPLMEARERWFPAALPKLHSLTNAHSYRYQILLQRGEEESVRAVWEALKRRRRPWHLLELERFPVGYPADEALMGAARQDGHAVGVWHGGVSPYLTLQGTWERYFESLKPKFRSNLRNRTKRLEKLGRLEIEMVSDRSGCSAALQDALGIEEASWKGEAGSAIASDATLRGFYTAWGERAAERGWLRLWFLKLDGRRVAFEYNVEYKGVLYCQKIGYRPELHPYSPGQVLKRSVLERAFQDGLREYDFLGVMDEAKSDWTGTGRPFTWAYVYARTVPARLHHALKFSWGPLLKRAAGRR